MDRHPLTHDEIRRVRFPMSSRWSAGYEVRAVDAFLDRVEEGIRVRDEELVALRSAVERLRAENEARARGQ